jgi:hypothetical protein
VVAVLMGRWVVAHWEDLMAVEMPLQVPSAATNTVGAGAVHLTYVSMEWSLETV